MEAGLRASGQQIATEAIMFKGGTKRMDLLMTDKTTPSRRNRSKRKNIFQFIVGARKFGVRFVHILGI